MTRSWAELLGDEQGTEESEAERRRFFGRLRSSLGRTRNAIRLPIGRFDPRDDESWEVLEAALISADVGMAATDTLVERLRKVGARHGRSPGEVAITWTLRNLAVTGAIVGARNAAQVEGIIGSANFTLTPEEITEIENEPACQISNTS